MTNADILAKLHEDVAAANRSTPSPSTHTVAGCRVCAVEAERKAANARLAALDGPALLEALMFLVDGMTKMDARIFIELWKGSLAEKEANDAIADAGKVLEL